MSSVAGEVTRQFWPRILRILCSRPSLQAANYEGSHDTGVRKGVVWLEGMVNSSLACAV